MHYLRKVHRLAGLLARLVEGVVGAILAAQVLLLFYSAVQNLGGWQRQALWLQEMAQYGLVQLAMLGAAVALRAGAHQGVDALTAVFPKPVQRVVEAINWVIIVAFGLYFAWCGLAYVRATAADGGTLDSIPLPKWIFYLCYPAAGALFAAFGVEKLLDIPADGGSGESRDGPAIAEDGA